MGFETNELLFQIVSKLAAVEAHQAEIKDDLKHHMKRTAQVEAELKYLHRQINLAHGAIALIGFVITLIGLYAKFKG